MNFCIKRLIGASIVASGIWAVANIGEATTVTTSIVATYTGHTSLGGINQSGEGWNGYYKYYGDIWNGSYVFDLGSLQSGNAQITSAKIELGVGSFFNDLSQSMTLAIGSYSGDISKLETSNFQSPTYQTDTSIYAAMMGTTYGLLAMPSALAQGDVIGINFNSGGLAALNAVTNGAGSPAFAMASSFGYRNSDQVYNENQALNTTDATLQLTYMTVAPVPLPASGYLLLAALAAAGLFFTRTQLKKQGNFI